MSVKTQIVRNKSSPNSTFQEFADKINKIGAGIWRIIGNHQENGKSPDKQFSGLLLDTCFDKGDLIYIIVNGSKYRVVVTDTEKCFKWRKLIELNQPDQFIPVNKENKLTFKSGCVERILPIPLKDLKQMWDTQT